jgi:hypothetical protein
MKALLTIPLSVAIFIVAGILATSGHGGQPMAALMAGAVGALAGILGWLPMVIFKLKGAVENTQLALVGTIVHLGSAVALTIVTLKSNAVQVQGPFVFWVMGAYLVSLVTLIWNLRQRLLQVADASSQESLPGAKVKE